MWPVDVLKVKDLFYDIEALVQRKNTVQGSRHHEILGSVSCWCLTEYGDNVSLRIYIFVLLSFFSEFEALVHE